MSGPTILWHSFGVLEDLGCIPSLSDWLAEMPAKPRMTGRRKTELRIAD